MVGVAVKRGKRLVKMELERVEVGRVLSHRGGTVCVLFFFD